MDQNPNRLIQRNYDQKAQIHVNKLERETKQTFQLKAFNNWIKAVLIQTQTKQTCRTIERELDLKIGSQSKILHVLDIGCGRGQDIPKWKLARLQYMVAVDFSEECIRSYQDRWRKNYEPYRLFTLVQDFTKQSFYYEIQHSYYDIVSAQLCFHYMFSSEQALTNGLAAILSNLLVGGVFIATIPDSYTILKKIEEKGKKQEDGSKVYGNKYFSIRFQNTNFSTPYGNKYGFYLQDAIGSKNQDGSIEYTNEWLIELDSLKQTLSRFGVEIEETMNFLDYYKKYRDDYKELFQKFKLVFAEGEMMKESLWQIAHLYRVLICRKKDKGKKISQFNIKDRNNSITRELRMSRQEQPRRYPNKNYPEQRNHSSNDRYRSRDDKRDNFRRNNDRS